VLANQALWLTVCMYVDFAYQPYPHGLTQGTGTDKPEGTTLVCYAADITTSINGTARSHRLTLRDVGASGVEAERHAALFVSQR
jgi:hypothetical protein